MDVDPLKLADVTLKAVDEIGSRAAAEIKQQAHEVRRGAEQVAKNLEALADAIVSHTVEANQHVAKFLAHTRNVVETVRSIQTHLTTPEKGNGADQVDDHRVLKNIQSRELPKPPRGGVADI